MISRTRQLGLSLLCCGLVLAPATWAFFPIGGYDSTGVLRYEKYNRSEFDRNNNGDVEEDEGIEIYIENGKSGFTEAELEVVYESLRVWERVPQSYACTMVRGLVQDPTFSALFVYDGLNAIVMQVTATQDLDGDGLPDENVEPDPPEVIVPVPGALGASATFWAADETTVEVGGITYIVGAGTIIDNDIFIDASAHRPGPGGEEPVADLMGTLVHELGHFYGLHHTPLNNVQAELAIPGDPTSQTTIVESTVLSHSIGGVRRRIGVTPTMYSFLFKTVEDNGDRRDGGSDLSPDDIAGISWLYPRGSQDIYFGLAGEARTRTTAGTGLPSAQIPNGHVVAWADVDNDPTTPRVAVFSTLTSLFVNSTLFPERDGRFELFNLWKTMETESGVFNVSYTFTNNALNGTGYERQAPPGSIPSTFASIAPGTAAFNNVYPSEVLHEAGNIIDISNKDAGTPFVWDFQRQTLVSVNTDRSISSIVGNNPMFGDPNDVCIFNSLSDGAAGAEVGAGGAAGVTGSMAGNRAVRSLRDGILLETALGSFVVDVYYSISPTAARFLLSSSGAYAMTARGVAMAYWCLDHYLAILSFLLVGFLGIRFLRRSRLARAAGTVLIVAVSIIVSSSAEARLLFQTTDQLVANATDIVAGTIVSAQSRRDTAASRIYTDVVIEVEDTAKGTLNKQSTVTFSQLGGRVGGLVYEVSAFPKFATGESVILYLVYIEGHGYAVYNGFGGKTLVSVARSKKSKTVTVPEDVRKRLQKSLPEGEEAPRSMALSDYMAALRAIVKEQAAAAE